METSSPYQLLPSLRSPAVLGNFFALPIAAIAKISGGNFVKAYGITTLGSAILGGVLSLLHYNSEAKIKAYESWREKNWDRIKKIVEKNLPPKSDLQRLFKFYQEADRLSEMEYESNGYFLRVGNDLESLAYALAPILYLTFKDSDVPTNYSCPIPVLSIEAEEGEEQQILYYDKKLGYIKYGNKITTPRKFVLESIDKIEMTWAEDEDWFIEYKKEFIEIVNKFLW